MNIILISFSHLPSPLQFDPHTPFHSQIHHSSNYYCFLFTNTHKHMCMHAHPTESIYCCLYAQVFRDDYMRLDHQPAVSLVENIVSLCHQPKLAYSSSSGGGALGSFPHQTWHVKWHYDQTGLIQCITYRRHSLTFEDFKFNFLILYSPQLINNPKNNNVSSTISKKTNIISKEGSLICLLVSP